MTKLRTLSEFQDALDKSFAWRLREVSYIRTTALGSESFAQVALLRAGLPLLYAHWEGFVKQASEIYIGYVSEQRIPYQQLASCFVVFGAKKHLLHLTQSKSATANIEAVEFLRTSESLASVLALSTSVNTESNLSSIVFENIATSIGVTLAPYSAYANLIDKTLVDRRNKIAHGEFLELDVAAFLSLAEDVTKLLRMYKNDIENLASTKAFLRNAVAFAA